jgi:hypothetical protein
MFKHALGYAVLGLTACTSMRRVDPSEFIPAHNPYRVSVWTLPDRVTILSNPTIVSNPVIRGDSLTGTVLDTPWAVALKDVGRVEAQTWDPKRTALLMGGVAAAGIGLYVASTSARGTTTIPCMGDLPPDLGAQLCGLGAP